MYLRLCCYNCVLVILDYQRSHIALAKNTTTYIHVNVFCYLQVKMKRMWKMRFVNSFYQNVDD